MLLLLWQGCAKAQGNGNYGAKIYYVSPSGIKLQEPLADFQEQLKEATGKEFILQADAFAGEGILIQQLVPGRDDAQGIDSTNADQFKLVSDGTHYLKILAFYRQGLINGLYTYLDTLGFRWYQPGPSGAHIPALQSIALALNQVYSPDFAMRNFFGSFGTPRNEVVDKSKTADTEWRLWVMRNRGGGTFDLKGHSGNTFMQKNKNALQLHPEYTALVDGKRTGYKTGAKFCISNKALQDLFVAYYTDELKQEMMKHPGEVNYCISVEPSDGGGDCTCDECKALGTVSDRDFLLANLVAKAFQQISPRAFVNLYAYNTHAAPPAQQLEPNVLVQEIPYKYQNYAKPEEMMQAWAAKSSRLFMYDYLGLPVQNLERPLHNDKRPANLAHRMQHWYDLNIRGITLESSYSTGSTGFAVYVFLRLGWKVHTDFYSLEKEYYDGLFGAAAAPVLEAAHALQDSLQYESLLPGVMQQLQAKTESLTLTKGQQESLIAFKAYLHYLFLFQEIPGTPETDADELTDRIMQFVYGTYTRLEVNPFVVTYALQNNGKTKKEVNAAWDWHQSKNPAMKFGQVHPWTDQEIESAFKEDLEKSK